MTATMNALNCKLIFQLSLFGLAMAVATVLWIPSRIEPAFWLVIFLFCAFVIAKRSPGKNFLHGFMVSLGNCVWITSIHVLFADTYLANHPQEAEMMARMPLPGAPRLMMLLFGPVVGIASGLVLGILSLIASKFVTKQASEA